MRIAQCRRAEDKQSRIPFLRNLKSHRRGSTASARSSSPTSTSASQSQSQSQIQSQTESTAQVSAAGSQSQSECGTPAHTEADESVSISRLFTRAAEQQECNLETRRDEARDET